MRGRASALAMLLAGGALALVASAQPWWRAIGPGISVGFTGSEATGGLSQALAVVVLAGTLLILVLRAPGRRIIGGLLIAAGAGVTALGTLRIRPGADAVRTQVREVSLADQFALIGSAWPWVYAAAGLLALAGATSVIVNAPRWRATAARFERGPSTGPSAVAADPADVWRALDEGLDPTLDAAGEAAADPDVRKSPTGDTMENAEQAQSPNAPNGNVPRK
jgi:uncharacterized membrane protein (TIGR02234 family)